MKVRVRLFAAAREQVGRGELVQELPDEARIQTLIDTLFRAYPGLLSMRLRFTVNAAYAAPETPLQDGDEVACIPPVGGG